MATRRSRLSSTKPISSRRRSPGESAEPLFAKGELVSKVYEVRGLLGAGGMSQVFDAQDRELGRRVALKVVLETTDPESLRLEGRALAAIQHPSVVTVYASGVHRGIDYLVLERVPGISLQQYMDKRRERDEPFSVAEVLDLLIAVAEGLTVVHRAGLTHRDIKPGNVMLAPGNRVVLMDFGLTLPQIDQLEHARVVGSLEYMAPESLMGQVTQQSGPLLDVYSLGVVAYELLADDVPYVAETPAAFVSLQVEHPVPNVADARPGTPPSLALLVTELLAPNPADRPQTVEAVLWRLRSIRDRARPSGAHDPFSVLIVDDDEDMHKRLADYVHLVIPEAEIETATSGRQALRSVRKHVPNVILLDLDLPDVNGVEVCMYLRGMNVGDRCMIVAVSGRARQPDVLLLDQFGVTFVPKGPELMQRLLLVLDTVRPVAPSSAR